MKRPLILSLWLIFTSPGLCWAESDSLCKLRPDLCGEKSLKHKRIKQKKAKRLKATNHPTINLDHYVQQNSAHPNLKQKLDSQQAFIEPKRRVQPEAETDIKAGKDQTLPLTADQLPKNEGSEASEGGRSPASDQQNQ